jgi:hypothetical protein
MNFLGGSNLANYKLMETGTNHWISIPTIGTNESGFTSLPGGRRFPDSPLFMFMGTDCLLWSSWGPNASDGLMLNNYECRISFFSNFEAFSIRCLKEYKIVLRILDATSWTLENQTLSIVPNAVIKLYTTQSSFDNNIPDFTTTSDANGMVLLSNLPIQNQYNYFLIVEKTDLRNIKDGYIICGVFNNQEDISTWPTQAGAYVGGLKYNDVNGDGIINSDDRTWHDLISVTGDQTVTKTIIIGK